MARPVGTLAVVSITMIGVAVVAFAMLSIMSIVGARLVVAPFLVSLVLPRFHDAILL